MITKRTTTATSTSFDITLPKELIVFKRQPVDSVSVHDLVDGGLLVTRTSDDVLVVRRYIATEHRRGFLRL